MRKTLGSELNLDLDLVVTLLGLSDTVDMKEQELASSLLCGSLLLLLTLSPCAFDMVLEMYFSHGLRFGFLCF